MLPYDAIVIGSGQGGSPLAHKLADRDWTVALIEREHLGGTCVNYGCTPTKTMIASARVAHISRSTAGFGVDVGDVRVSLSEIVARKDEMVTQWREGQERHAAERPTLDVYREHARFAGPQSVEAGGKMLTSNHIFINTGTRPRIPTLHGLDEVDVLTNRTIMALQDVPDHLLVLGGSYLGLEFGQMFRRFGSEVTIIEQNDRIIAREDREVSEALQHVLEAEGVRFLLGVDAIAVARSPPGVSLTFRDAEGNTSTLSGTHVLAATGRLPNTDDLGLKIAGVEMDDHGYVRVNDRLETSVRGIWAIGDVKGGPAFTHISYDDHLIIYDNLINGTDRRITGRLVPYAVFTDPELGRAGMTEGQAREAGYNVKVGSIPMSRVARAIESGETAGLMKVVIDADSDRILGAAVLSASGGELVQTLMVLMLADAPWTVMKQAVYIHPTLAEGFFALMEQVQ